MKVGYMRVSTDMQKHDMQEDALMKDGCGMVYKDVISGKTKRRPGLDGMLKALSAGDTLVVWRLDRLGRSLQNLLEILADLKNRGVSFRSLNENIDTSTPTGVLLFQVMGAVAEFERNVISERVKSGVAAKRKRNGGKWGRESTIDVKKVRTLGVKRAVMEMGISRATAYRVLGNG